MSSIQLCVKVTTATSIHRDSDINTMSSIQLCVKVTTATSIHGDSDINTMSSIQLCVKVTTATSIHRDSDINTIQCQAFSCVSRSQQTPQFTVTVTCRTVPPVSLSLQSLRGVQWGIGWP
eukprot:TRINITY_DN16646_c0_g1_i1.p1 TRINITY_DN16646_c0_g1~~TRINITY_DN16646_c0_g1_i1.p1  ORF type:complete len:120 (-),score=17.22 TRINITY_DN16646_c0_g1_i1:192-551(-)